MASGTRASTGRVGGRLRRAGALLGARVLPLLLAGLLATTCGRGPSPAPRVIILGMDGLDYTLTQHLIEAGRLPHFAGLAEMGGFSAVTTTVPPQSPVAWSTFLTGLDPGGHGIFDFLHRDPESLFIYPSTTETTGGDPILTLGDWQIPGSGSVESLRRGTPFWEVLERHGVQTSILRMPANFPPSGSASRELSGMGTPDLTGTDGTFSFYTSELFAFAGQDVSGGEIYEVDVYDNVVETALHGPDNPMRVEGGSLEVPLTIYLDPEQEAVKIEVDDHRFVLAVGEWSDWAAVDFPMIGDLCIPRACVSGIVRFYLKQVRPELELYATPIDMDPMAPAMPVSTPGDYAAELAEATGLFYTEGMPEDTKTITERVFTHEEFLGQARNAGQEVIDQYDYVLDRFDDGLLFYYFGNVDQTSHILWRSMDPEHPFYDAERDAPFADVIPQLYEGMDRVVGKTMEWIEQNAPDTLLVVMSDHGFTSWRRTFHLNAWLRENGYLAPANPGLGRDPGLLLNVDWSRTRAYGYGFNGLYVNLAGREREGIVPAAERRPLLRELAEKLLAELDPTTGGPAITEVHLSEEVYRDRGALEVGPDLIVGYARGVRPSNDSAMGELSGEILSDNTGEWSGDHMMDHREVPGILLTNRPLARPATAIGDLAGAILYEYGIEDFPIRE